MQAGGEWSSVLEGYVEGLSYGRLVILNRELADLIRMDWSDSRLQLLVSDVLGLGAMTRPGTDSLRSFLRLIAEKVSQTMTTRAADPSWHE